MCLLKQVLKFMDLTHKNTLERLESLLYKLKWSQFSGVQMLLLKVCDLPFKLSSRTGTFSKCSL